MIHFSIRSSVCFCWRSYFTHSSGWNQLPRVRFEVSLAAAAAAAATAWSHSEFPKRNARLRSTDPFQTHLFHFSFFSLDGQSLFCFSREFSFSTRLLCWG